MSDKPPTPGDGETIDEVGFEAELNALRTCWRVLAPLNQEARDRAIEYVRRRLQKLCPACQAILDRAGRCTNDACPR